MAGDPTKSCPHCRAEVPSYAIKCKHCFGDLTVPPASRRGMWGWVILLVIMVTVGAIGLNKVFNTDSLAQVTIDEPSQAVFLVWTHYNGPPTTRKVPFQDIAKIEFITDASIFGSGFWEVYLVTNSGERVLINRNTTEDLQAYAESVTLRVKKPLIPINKVRIGTQVLGQNGAQSQPD